MNAASFLAYAIFLVTGGFCGEFEPVQLWSSALSIFSATFRRLCYYLHIRPSQDIVLVGSPGAGRRRSRHVRMGRRPRELHLGARLPDGRGRGVREVRWDTAPKGIGDGLVWSLDTDGH